MISFSPFLPKYADLMTSDVIYSLTVGSSSSLPDYISLNGQIIQIYTISNTDQGHYTVNLMGTASSMVGMV